MEVGDKSKIDGLTRFGILDYLLAFGKVIVCLTPRSMTRENLLPAFQLNFPMMGFAKF